MTIHVPQEKNDSTGMRGGSYKSMFARRHNVFLDAGLVTGLLLLTHREDYLQALEDNPGKPVFLFPSMDKHNNIPSFYVPSLAKGMNSYLAEAEESAGVPKASFHGVGRGTSGLEASRHGMTTHDNQMWYHWDTAAVAQSYAQVPQYEIERQALVRTGNPVAPRNPHPVVLPWKATADLSEAIPPSDGSILRNFKQLLDFSERVVALAFGEPFPVSGTSLDRYQYIVRNLPPNFVPTSAEPVVMPMPIVNFGETGHGSPGRGMLAHGRAFAEAALTAMATIPATIGEHASPTTKAVMRGMSTILSLLVRRENKKGDAAANGIAARALDFDAAARPITSMLLKVPRVANLSWRNVDDLWHGRYVNARVMVNAFPALKDWYDKPLACGYNRGEQKEKQQVARHKRLRNILDEAMAEPVGAGAGAGAGDGRTLDEAVAFITAYKSPGGIKGFPAGKLVYASPCEAVYVFGNAAFKRYGTHFPVTGGEGAGAPAAAYEEEEEDE
jgi:hypothetical protein